MITSGDIKVYCKYGISSILDMEMETGEGRHGKLVLRGLISGGMASHGSGESVRVAAAANGADREETLFCGNILKTHIFVENGVGQVILSAESCEGEMDREKHSRSFQNPMLTYAQIIKDVLSKYGGAFQCGILPVKTGKPVLQYEETDWEFCRRMAGNMGLGLFSQADSACPQLTAGLVEGEKAEFPADSYRCGVAESYYHDGKRSRLAKPEFLYYKVSSGQHYRTGDYAWYKGRKLHIYEVKAKLEKEGLVFTYGLGGEGCFRGTTHPNRKLSGLALPGEVEKAEGESVYLKLDIDGKDGKAAYPFAWMPPTGNLAYCMPQAGTRAFLYFPDCHGQDAVAVGSARTNGTAPCFGNAQDRGLMTEHGKQLQLHGDALRLMGGLQQAALGTEGLCLQAGKGKFVLRAGGGICIQAPSVIVRTPLSISQQRTGKKKRKNPATGGTGTSIQSQYEFSISAPLGELIGTEYVEYWRLADEIAYESYERVEKRRLLGLAGGIVAALAVGALAVGIAFFGVGVAITTALAVGAVVAGVGSAASAATYMQDKEDGTASPARNYITNAAGASLKTFEVICVFWSAGYKAKAIAEEVMQGASVVSLFGEIYTFESLAETATIWTEGLATSYTFFQTMELLAFFGGTKELGESTGWTAYDDWNELTGLYAAEMFWDGSSYWWKEKQKQLSNPAGTNTKPKEEAAEPKTTKAGPEEKATGVGEGGTGLGEGNETLKRKDITDLLNSGKTPDDLLKAGYSVDDLLEAGVAPDDLPGYQHLVTGEGLVRKKEQVVGGHNIDSFYAAIKQDAQNLGLDISDYNIKITEHPTIKGLYQIEYSIPKVNGNTNPLTPLYDNTGELLTKLAADFKTVYNTTEIGFSDIEIYAMGKQALEAEILAGNVSDYTVQATINGITFKGYYRNGVLTNFFPIFE